MIFFSFGNRAFNKEYRGINIDMVISSKHKYKNALLFLDEALKFMNEKIYPDEFILSEYSGLKLKDGEYREIVKHYILSMDQSIEIKFDDIIKIQRIKRNNFNPLQEDFLIETKEEYMMFMWSITD